jgi:creatinine amidohydrolase
MLTEKFRFEELTWEEAQEVSQQDRVVILPAATIEQHGKHLPLGTDYIIGWEVCQEVARRAPREALLMPPVIYGYSPHHMDFPGSIGIAWDNFVRYVTDICCSLAHHGFKRILVVNSHGSNHHLLDAACRQTMLRFPDAIVALTWVLPLSKKALEVIQATRQSGHGGISHACELETSLCLFLRPELVYMEKAEKDISWPESAYIYFDLVDGPVLSYTYWSALSKTGTMGDPTVATREKGKAWFELAVTELLNIVRELRTRPLPKRVDHHSPP